MSRRKKAEPLLIAGDSDLEAAEVALILQQRTRALAAIPPQEEKSEAVEAVIFALGESRYAIDVQHVTGIFPLEGLTPTPCTPDFVVGIINLRGRILSVIDLQRFLGLEPTPLGDRAQVIAASAAGLEAGILASKVHAVRPIPLGDLKPTLPTSTRLAVEFTRGVTPDLIVFLDLEKLLSDERMIVREEVR